MLYSLQVLFLLAGTGALALFRSNPTPIPGYAQYAERPMHFAFQLYLSRLTLCFSLQEIVPSLPRPYARYTGQHAHSSSPRETILQMYRP